MTSRLILFPMAALVEKPAGLATTAHGASNKQPPWRQRARSHRRQARRLDTTREAVGDVEGLVDNLLAAFDPDYGKGS